MAPPEKTQAVVHYLPEPVKVQVEGREVEVESLEALEKILSGIVSAVEASIDPDPKAGAAFARSAGRIQSHLGRLVMDSAWADETVDDLGIEFFVEDDGWRGLVESVTSLSGDFDDLKVLVLARYRRYLIARASAHGVDGRLVPPEEATEPRIESVPLAEEAPNEEALLDATIALREPGPSLDGDLPDLDPAGVFSESDPDPRAVARTMREHRCTRLSRGLEVVLNPQDAENLPIWLSAWCFRLRQEDGVPMLVVEDTGREYLLREGQNLVGRALYNDVVLDERYTQISRRHVIVHVRNGWVYALTDVSSQGTYVPRDAMSGARPPTR